MEHVGHSAPPRSGHEPGRAGGGGEGASWGSPGLSELGKGAAPRPLPPLRSSSPAPAHRLGGGCRARERESRGRRRAGGGAGRGGGEAGLTLWCRRRCRRPSRRPRCTPPAAPSPSSSCCSSFPPLGTQLELSLPGLGEGVLWEGEVSQGGRVRPAAGGGGGQERGLRMVQLVFPVTGPPPPPSAERIGGRRLEGAPQHRPWWASLLACTTGDGGQEGREA